MYTFFNKNICIWYMYIIKKVKQHLIIRATAKKISYNEIFKIKINSSYK